VLRWKKQSGGLQCEQSGLASAWNGYGVCSAVENGGCHAWMCILGFESLPMKEWDETKWLQCIRGVIHTGSNTDCHGSIKVGHGGLFGYSGCVSGALGFEFFQRTCRGTMKSCKFQNELLVSIQEGFSMRLSNIVKWPSRSCRLSHLKRW
jgi:hypothetical protein